MLKLTNILFIKIIINIICLTLEIVSCTSNQFNINSMFVIYYY